MKVLIYPKSSNPYLELLYGQMRALHPNDVFSYLDASVVNLCLFPLVLLRKRLQGYSVFHLHWHTFYIDEKHRVPFAKVLSLVTTLGALATIKLLGYRLVWTVHNVQPHEQKTINDKFVTRFTVWLADELIVHSTDTQEELREMGLAAKESRVIPHGNYIDVYPVNATRDQAREQLRIEPNDFVVLNFGNVRPYKGIEQLLEFASKQKKHLRVFVVGRCDDKELEESIQERVSDRVTFVNEYIPDNIVSLYFLAADVVCAPFKAVSTSGSVLLALSFGKPVIAPRLGAIKDLPEGAGYFYDANDKDGLIKAINSSMADEHGLKNRSAAALSYAKSLSWKSISESTYLTYLGRKALQYQVAKAELPR